MVKFEFHQLELRVVPLSLKFSILLRSIPDLPKNSCVVIFKCKTEELPMKWITGEDITIENQAKDANSVFDFAMNLGEGKFMPGGPKCTYMGQTVDCLTFGS